MLITALSFALLIYYEIDAQRKIPKSQQTKWMILLLIFSVFVYPLYWWRWVIKSAAAT